VASTWEFDPPVGNVLLQRMNSVFSDVILTENSEHFSNKIPCVMYFVSTYYDSVVCFIPLRTPPFSEIPVTTRNASFSVLVTGLSGLVVLRIETSGGFL
jgi:hypothetical protein